MKKSVFCESTSIALQQISSIFDFSWPAYTALWNLRWQVRGYLNAMEEEKQIVSNEKLKSIFVTKSLHGVNLINLSKSEWIDLEDVFSQILLTYAFSIYEGWIEEIGTILNWKRKNKEALQHYISYGKKTSDIKTFLKEWHTELSPKDKLVRDVLYGELKKNKKYAYDSLIDLMKCYRCFKEARNAFVHTNGKITENLKTSYDIYIARQSAIQKIIKEAPIFLPLGAIGDKFSLSLRGVVGFYNIIINLIVTLDAELANSKYAEKLFIYRIQGKTIKERATKHAMIVGFFRENGILFDKSKVDSIIDLVIK